MALDNFFMSLFLDPSIINKKTDHFKVGFTISFLPSK
jgi:hypothetical protein